MMADIDLVKAIDQRTDFFKMYYPAAKKLFNILEEDFLKYYDDSNYSGYPIEPGGSVWISEGKFIYMMIRHLKPKRILEIGNFKGRGSTNHILQAVADNEIGEVTLLDIHEYLEYDRLHNKNFNRVLEDSLKYLERPFAFDLIVQDGSHEYEHVKKELQLMIKNSQQNFWLWGHDYYMVKPPQCEVARAWEDVKTLYENVTPLKDSVSNCGFIVANFKK